MCKKTKKENNYMVVVTRGEKVIDLLYSHNLSDMQAIRLMHRVEHGHHDCKFETVSLAGYVVREEVNEPQLPLSRNGNPPNRVKCIDTGYVYDSVKDCARILKIPENSIRQSIRFGKIAYGHRFVMIPPMQKINSERT